MHRPLYIHSSIPLFPFIPFIAFIILPASSFPSLFVPFIKSPVHALRCIAWARHAPHCARTSRLRLSCLALFPCMDTHTSLPPLKTTCLVTLSCLSSPPAVLALPSSSGCRELPQIDPKTIGKMGLKGVPGLNVGGGGKGGGGQGRAQGGGRGRG